MNSRVNVKVLVCRDVTDGVGGWGMADVSHECAGVAARLWASNVTSWVCASMRVYMHGWVTRVLVMWWVADDICTTVNLVSSALTHLPRQPAQLV